MTLTPAQAALILSDGALADQLRRLAANVCAERADVRAALLDEAAKRLTKMAARRKLAAGIAEADEAARREREGGQ